MNSLIERIKWVLLENRAADTGLLAAKIIQEIETTHRITDPEIITEEMVEACFTALPKHYDPPDPKRRLWHAYKAKHRFTAMVKKVPKIIDDIIP